jgi:hypothetical protein
MDIKLETLGESFLETCNVMNLCSIRGELFGLIIFI